MIAAPAAAQEVAETNSAEIVVIGTREQGYRATVAPQVNKSDTPIKETPYSVQVVTRELIADRGITTIGEALRYVPGFSPQVGFVGSNDRFYIRGFITPYNLKNGLRRSAYAPDEQLQNIEQVEILKGPASALYGRFEPGGVVNFVTKKPQNRAFAEFGGLYGSFDQVRLTFDGNVPLGDDAGFRLNASYDDKGSWRDYGFSRDLFVAPVAQWRPGNATTITLEGEYARKRGYADRGFANNPIFLQAPRDRQFGEADARYENKGGVVSLFVDHRFSDVFSGRIAAGYSDFTKDTFYYPYGFPPVGGTTTATPRVNRRVSDAYDRQRDLTAQAELYARFATGSIQHKALIGAELSYDRWRFDVLTTPFGVNLPIDFFNPSYGQRAVPTSLASDGAWNTDSSAIYAQDELLLGGGVRLLGGLRYDWTEGRTFERTIGTDTSTKRNKLSPRAGVTWTPVQPVSLYASWSRSFRGQVDVGRLRDGRLPEPLIGEAFEVGAKADLLGGRLRPTIALFDITRRNVAVSDPTDPNFEFVIQVGKSRSRGLEVEVPAVLSPRWRLIANYTYLDAEVREDSFLASGLRLVNAPRHSASLWTTYDLAGALQGASVGIGAQHIGRRAGNTDNTIFLPAYTRVDANVGYNFELGCNPLRAQLNVLNVFDTFYYDSGGAFIPIYPGAPRTVTVSLGYRFGAGR
ncbi:TonB-dependent siderophore receptor [Novosphingobium sp. ERN07]|nr:TonB-dependent siderophore receptor [Novosphingobium sp. ERN07]